MVTLNSQPPKANLSPSGLVVKDSFFFLFIFFIKFTNFGIYAVAGVSTLCNLIRNMIFTLPVTAKYLGYKWNKFFPQVIMTIISSIGLIIVFYLVNIILPKGSWTNLIISAIILGIIGLIISILILLNKKERAFLLSKISNKIHIKKFRKK